MSSGPRWSIAMGLGGAILIGGLMVACGPHRGHEEAEALSGEHSAVVEIPQPPDLVVVYVLDALRADHVGGSGLTPVLDRLADEGVSFPEFSSVAASTMTFAKTIFSGRFFLESGGLPGEVETLAEVMRAAGYRTIGISGNGHVSEKFGLTRGFDTFDMVYPLARGADPATYVNRNAADIHRRALELLGDEPRDTPTFMYLHTIHPHTPYAPPHELARTMCGDIPSSIDGMSPTLLAIRDGELDASEEDRRRLRCLYAASVRYNDAEIEEFLKKIRERNPEGELLLVVTSDHGEEFFDHGGVLHGHTLYDELLRVPLIVHWPGRLQTARLSLRGDTFDLHETLRTLVRAPMSSAGAEGRSLWPAMLSGDDAALEPKLHHAAVPTLPGGMFMVRSQTHKLVLAPRKDGGPGMGLGLGRSHDLEYLFDLRSDPGETENLIGGGSAHEGRLRSNLQAWIERTTRQTGSSDVVLDDETRKHLEALGYVQ